MNLQPLFETQKKLDDRIEKEKGLEGHDLLDKKILALQVELGELANEWRGFKFWSDDQLPRDWNERPCDCSMLIENCKTCEGAGNIEIKCSPLLEEYVDCLHFILSIGNDLGYSKAVTEDWISEKGDYSEESTTDTFIMLLDHAAGVYVYEDDMSIQADIYEVLILALLSLGLQDNHLGFTWEQIEQAYYDKNKVNHERQTNGY